MTIPGRFPLAAYLKRIIFEVSTKINIHSYNSLSVPVNALVILVDAGAKSKINERQVYINTKILEYFIT